MIYITKTDGPIVNGAVTSNDLTCSVCGWFGRKLLAKVDATIESHMETTHPDEDFEIITGSEEPSDPEVSSDVDETQVADIDVEVDNDLIDEDEGS